MAGAAVEVAAANGGGAGCCAAKGPGYAMPREAMEKGPREGLLYVTCVYNGTPSFLLGLLARYTNPGPVNPASEAHADENTHDTEHI